MDELELRDRALAGDNDAIGELVQLAGERGDLDLLRELTAAGSSDAAAELVQLATEIGDLGELRRLASLGNSDAADVLLELDKDPAGRLTAGDLGHTGARVFSVRSLPGGDGDRTERSARVIPRNHAWLMGLAPLRLDAAVSRSDCET